MATNNNDYIFVQGSSTATIDGLGGDDVFVISPYFVTEGQTVSISDTQGANTIQLVGGLTITSSIVEAEGLRLTLSNDAVITVFGADNFTYNVGGNDSAGIAGVDKDFTTFASENLGVVVPAAGEAAATGGEAEFNEDGTSTTPEADTYALTADAATVDEGASATFSLDTNLAEGTEVAYTISGDVDAADVDGGLTGTATVDADGDATITVGLVEDVSTDEGAETLTVTVDADPATTADVTVNDTSMTTTFTLTTDAAATPEGVAKVFTVEANQPVTEDTVVTFNVTAGSESAADQGTTLTNMNDFAGGTFAEQTATIAAGETTATFEVTGANDGITEYDETYSVSVDVAGETFTAEGTLTDGAGTFTLTTGVDDVAGTRYDDTINGTDTTVTALDTIDGGDGTDTLNYNDVAGATDPGAGVTVSGVEILNMRSAGAANMTTTGWTGLETINTTQGTAANITAATTTDVNVSNITGAVAVDGGKDIAVTAAATGTTTTIGATTVGAGTVTVTDTAQAGSAIAVDGGTDVTITASGNTNGAINVGQRGVSTDLPSGAVAVSSTGVLNDAGNAAGADDVTMGNITVTGGSSVSVTQSAGITDAQVTAALTAVTNDTVTQGDVAVTGGTTTTSVSVIQDAAQAVTNTAAPNNTANQIGIENGLVAISDVNAASTTDAGTIETVTIDSWADNGVNLTGSFVKSSALTTLNLSGTGGDLAVTAGALTTAVVDTLALNVDGLTAGGIELDADYTTLNLASANTASTIGELTTAATTINISGDAALTVTDNQTASVTAINNTNTGGVTLGTELGIAVVFTGTAGSGDDSIKLAANTKATTTGAGDDTVILSTAALGTGGTIDAGADTDTLVMTAANAATATAGTAFADTISNFEQLSLNSAVAGQTINLANLDNINTIAIAAAGTSVTLSNVSSGVNVSADSGATGTIDVTQATDDTSATAADEINFSVSNTSAQTVATLDASEFEHINIASDDSAATATGIAHVITTLDATAATDLDISGDAGLTIGTLTGTALTSIDASGVTAGAVTFTTGALAAASTITGGAGDDAIDASAAIKAVTLSGNAGDDTLHGGTVADTITGGDGDDWIYGEAGGDSLTGNAGADIFAVTTATDSNGVNSDTITDFTVGTDAIGLQIASGNEAVTYLGEASAYGSVLTSFTGTANEAVLDTSTNTVYVDVNGDAALTDADISIDVGVSDLSQSDFVTLGTAGGDTIAGTAGVDTIFGLAGDDTITGGAGDDTITGGAGDDTITGGAGNDTIVNAAIATDGLDVITQFTTSGDSAGFAAGADKLQFSDADLEGQAGFVADTNGDTQITLNDGTKVEFVSGAGAQVAGDAQAAFLFNQTTGTLSFDADGTGGNAAIDIVTLTGVTDLAVADFAFVV